ncbi:MAG: hypothetical protein IKT98_08650 [Selenomonadaceae bacterium]|nr:hypothetical protein [Selenomonadaceae bacterium]
MLKHKNFFDLQRFATISNSNSYSLVSGTSGNDSIYNQYTTNVTINTGAGSDTIYSWGGQNGTIDGGADNDYIHIGHYIITDEEWFYGSKNLLKGGVGNDSIRNWGASATVNGGSGNDSLLNYGEYSTIIGSTGNDTIYNNWDFSTNSPHSDDYAWNVVFKYSSGDGNDIIYGFKSDSTLSISGDTYSTTKSGSDIIVTVGKGKITLVGAASLSKVNITGTYSSGVVTLKSSSDKTSLIGVSSNDSLYISHYSVTASGGAGNDTIWGYECDYAKIYGGDGNDIIYNYQGDYSYMFGGNGDDSIYNKTWISTIDAGNGNDTIINLHSGKNTSINGGDGNDLISLTSATDWTHEHTIKGGTGNDTIYGNSLAGNAQGSTYQFSSGDGNDIIYNFTKYDKISLGGGTYTRSTVGSDVVISVTSGGSMTLKNAKGEIIDIVGGTLQSSGGNSKLITLTSGNDTYNNTVKGATINALGGKDTIYNNNSNVSISGGKGNDYIQNSIGADNCTLRGGDGNDTISNNVIGNMVDGNIGGDKVLIDGGAGNDSIINDNDEDVTLLCGAGDDTVVNWAINTSINGGDGKDLIYIHYNGGTITGGNGNDTIYEDNYDENLGDGILYLYGADDGNDFISGFSSSDTLSIGGGSYSSVKSGNDIIFTVGEGKITLVGAASLSKVNVKGTKVVTKENSWKLSGTTATYGTSSKALVTVKGVKSTDGLTINITKKIVTVAAKSLNKKKVTVSDGYTLKLGNDVDTPNPSTAKWSHNGTTATYKSAGTTAGYTLDNNTITYSKAKSASTLATVKGIKESATLAVKNKVVTLTKANLSGSNVTVSGSYGFNFAKGDYKNISITASNNKDSITSSGSNLSIKGGKGNDVISLSSAAKNNVIVYNNGDGSDTISGFDENDTIKIVSTAKVTTSGNDVVFTVGKGSITVKDAKDKTFTYITNSGTKTYSTIPESSTPYTIDAAKTAVILSSAYAEKSFDVEKLGNKIVVIDASTVKKDLSITGNEKSNNIIGGAGNDTIDGYTGDDTLTGGDGADIFLYYNGDGNDVIADYSEEDEIQIEGSAKATTSGRDVILTVGKNKITVKNAAKNKIGVTYVENGIEHDYISGEQTVLISSDRKGKTVTLSEKYWKDTFDITKNFGTGIQTINATEVTQKLKITGNDKANDIWGGSGDDTLIGGEGNDTLYGSQGADVFVYAKGDGDDTIDDYMPGEDKIKLVSGAVSGDYYTQGDTVVLRIDSGKIRVNNSVGKRITIIEEDGTSSSKKYTAKPLADATFFLADDDDFATDNQLSSIVQSNVAADYSFLNTPMTLDKENNIIICADKK